MWVEWVLFKLGCVVELGWYVDSFILLWEFGFLCWVVGDCVLMFECYGVYGVCGDFWFCGEESYVE